MAENIVFQKKHRFLTNLQKLKRNNIIAIIISLLITIFVASLTVVIAIESNRLNNYYYDALAEERIINNGKTTYTLFSNYMKFYFQELRGYKSVLDDMEDSDLDTEEKVINVTKSHSMDTYLNDIGIIFNNAAYFKNEKVELTNIPKINGDIFCNGKTLNKFQSDYIYFFIPKCETHTSIQGIVGRMETNQLIAPIMPTAHDGNDSLIIVDSNYDMIIIASPEHKWRFATFENYTDAMRSWVDDGDFKKYEDFLNNPELQVLNVGKNDRDGMIYREKLKYGIDGNYYLILMAPKALLTKTISDLSVILLIILLTTLFVLLLTSILAVIVIYRQIAKYTIAYAFSPTTKLNKEETFFKDATAIAYSNSNNSYAVVFLNIKEFGIVNETYGGKTADGLLVEMGKKINALMNKYKEVACYQKGGNFLLFLEGKKDDLVFKVSSLNDHLSVVDGYEYIKLRLSFGIKLIDEKYPIIEREVEKAKFAEKNSKDEDLIRFYDEEMDMYQKELQDMTIQFEDAINNEEFEIYLQLKWNLKMNDWCGAETLVRWRHPKKGLISPGKFIPLFEENGYITTLDAYVFEKSCKLLRKMIDNGERVVPLSINLSKRHFSNINFMSHYEEIANKYEIPHNLIEFEITEGLLMDNVDVFTRFIRVFHDNDYFIAMDDFGSGYSSLNMIHELEFDIIKIDAKFFRAGLDESNKIIIRSIVSLCHKLHKTVVAEGIENEHEVEFLRDIGCDIIQGYYFAKPVPEDDFRNRLNESKESKDE
ncbi:MAG: GGDEF domain-containing phosphodiesterase [Acholeplasmatales bacterium]|nr:GGDEF domain-containing phosphodiesterase [Acholeplasmatales bacterium]